MYLNTTHTDKVFIPNGFLFIHNVGWIQFKLFGELNYDVQQKC